jgi:plasmid stability protein
MIVLGIIAIGIAFTAALVCAFLLGRSTAPKPTVPAVFGELPLHERPQSELHERTVQAEARAIVAEGINGELMQQLEQLRADLAHALWLKDRHWRSLRRLRTRIRTATVIQLYPRLELAS